MFYRGGVVFSGYARDHDWQAERPVRKLVDVNDVGMADLFNRAATWTRYDARAKMDVAARCPESLARIYLARGGIGWRLPVLRGVITSPTLLRNGSVLETPGYHAGSGLFFEPDGTSFPPIPRRPTRDDALAALALIDDLLEECAFVDATDRSVALAMILTGLVRRDLEAAPLFALTAPTPGTGKSFLASVAAFMATGRKPAGVGWVARNDNENAKVFDAALLAGGPVLLLDNIIGELNSARLNAMLSQSEINVRVLGGHREVTVPCNTLVLANGNNLVLPADMVRRSMLCRLNCGMENPEERVFRRNPVAEVRADRGRYVVARLSVLHAHRVAGSPSRPQPLAGYEEWSDWVRAALVWLGQADPVGCMRETTLPIHAGANCLRFTCSGGRGTARPP